MSESEKPIDRYNELRFNDIDIVRMGRALLRNNLILG